MRDASGEWQLKPFEGGVAAHELRLPYNDGTIHLPSIHEIIIAPLFPELLPRGAAIEVQVPGMCAKQTGDLEF